jgi:uncharacterized protein (TIGR02996 family)
VSDANATAATGDTGAALLAAIHANPDEDTPRLLYADWCDENGEHDRAELIRVQHERHQRYPSYQVGLTVDGATRKLLDRERELLAAHPEWSRATCPACRGSGFEKGRRGANGYYVQPRCPTCGGSGDLLKTWPHPVEGKAAYRPLSWRCGFPDSVTVPRLADVWDDRLNLSDTDPPGPTPWAVAVVRAVPLTRIIPADRVPYWNGAAHCWFIDGRSRPSELVPRSAVLPPPVFDAIEQPWSGVGTRWKGKSTAAAGVDALGRTLAALARNPGGST